MEINGKIASLRESLAPIAKEFEINQFSEADNCGFSKATIRIPGVHDCGEDLFRCLANSTDLRVRSMRMRQAPLEDVFLAATRRSWETLDTDLANDDPKPDSDEPAETEISAAS